jgi:copper chaperone
MEKLKINVPNISCGHCVNTIKMELEDVVGVSTVSGNADDKSIDVAWDAPATLQKIKDTLQEIGYPARD